MDILSKMFRGSNSSAEGNNDHNVKDEFRKPQWFEECETDDELFGDDRKFAVQIFTNPLELQKHFERQMQHIFEALNDIDENSAQLDKNLKEDFLKPGFEKNVFKDFLEHKKEFIDTDLDGEIYADEIHSLIQDFDHNDKEISTILPRNNKKNNQNAAPKKKLSDLEIIMSKIHGTFVEEPIPGPKRSRAEILTPAMPRTATPFGGVFDGPYNGPKMYSQSIISKTIRRPDGTYETTNITKDFQGNKKTTVTRTVDGRSETVTTYENSDGSNGRPQEDNTMKKDPEKGVYSDRNLYVSKEGYALPRNLW